MEYSIGQPVAFEMYDGLFKDFIVTTGIIECNIFGRLWSIKPDSHLRLSGGSVILHEDSFGLLLR
ncbi:hypothetical protein LCGC14_1305730 [marine sediment metagenome]|uniref:Uncharacterized protein n=1 Tax=marine sediment metagenome TaxID=412755 RepID=A0A0F9N529_9ZZZZ